MAFRHGGRDNLPLGIHPNMQFLPAFGLLLTVFLGMPFPLATDLQAAAVNDQGDRFLRGTIDLLLDRHRGVASRECRMIRAGKRHVHQGQDRMEEALGLAQWQAKEQPEHERRLNCDDGINRRGTSLTGHRRRLGVDGVLTDPQGDVATTAERLVILVPVFHANTFAKMRQCEKGFYCSAVVEL